MSLYLFASTERELEQDAIDILRKEKVIITDYSGKVRDGKTGHFYYEISNEISPDNGTLNTYNKIDNVEDALEHLHEKGNFRLIKIDTEYGEDYIKKIEKGYFEETVEHFPQEKIGLGEVLEKYPQDIESNRIYIVD